MPQAPRIGGEADSLGFSVTEAAFVDVEAEKSEPTILHLTLSPNSQH